MNPNLLLLSRMVGVPLSERETSDSHIFDGQSIATRYNGNTLDDAAILHEICHFMAAKPEQRDLPEFGLGYIAQFGQLYVVQVIEDDLSSFKYTESNLQEAVTQMLCVYLGKRFNISSILNEDPEYSSSWDVYLNNKTKEFSFFGVGPWEVLARVISALKEFNII